MKIDKEKRYEYLDYVMYEWERAIIRLEKIKRFKAEYGENRTYKKLEEKAHECESALRQIIVEELDII